LIKSVEVRM